ncbi:MAG: hypothetical protein KJ626_13570 [Verrucomicrobia bacterium]|nr:hypothetical protein [Verrucomicrobiota bacterium]
MAGHAESTHGILWVVGKHHELFDYFVPERWRRTHRKAISETNKTYYTKTKDQINLVWKVSRVGELPDIDPRQPNASTLVEHGFNSPFEEFDIALELSRKGIDTVYPRAIYMSGRESEQSGLYVVDTSRFENHKDILAMDGAPALRPNHSYITIWGYWNGLDEMLADKDQTYCEGIDLSRAWKKKLITHKELTHFLEREESRLENAGFVDLALKPTHFLLSILPDGSLLRDEYGEPCLRICNMELIKRTGEQVKHA